METRTISAEEYEAFTNGEVVDEIEAREKMAEFLDTGKKFEVIGYDVTEAELTRMEQYLQLSINGIDDSDGYKVVHTAEKEVRKTRAGLEKERKRLKAPLLKKCKELDGQAKVITGRLVIVETHLKEERAKVDDELDRIAQAEAAARKRVVESRVKQIQAVGGFLSFDDADALTDEQFAEMLRHETGLYNEKLEAEKAAAEEAERVRKENERLAQELAEKEAEIARKEAELEARLAALEVKENPPPPEPVPEDRPETAEEQAERVESLTEAPPEAVTEEDQVKSIMGVAKYRGVCVMTGNNLEISNPDIPGPRYTIWLTEEQVTRITDLLK